MFKTAMLRPQIEQGIRDFFRDRGFLETRTPLLVPSPGMEPHIRPFQVSIWGEAPLAQPVFLPTSPEFAMKQLLVAGLEKIFQISPTFRVEPPSSTHRPEFTMLEWYRAHANYEEIMADTEQLFEYLARRLFNKPTITFQGKEISLAAPWPRLRVRELFQKHTAIDLVNCDLRAECERLGLRTQPSDTWDDIYFRIWLNEIEPRLPTDQAVFVCEYPPSQASLSVVQKHPDGTSWARRFECYAGGFELGNAFQELTDPAEQRRRFIEDMDLREEIYGPSFPKTPLDETFLGALEKGMPPSAGIAVGVDRMIMLLADEPEIEKTFFKGLDVSFPNTLCKEPGC